MEISPGKVVTIEYKLEDDDGKVLDTSAGRKPLVYLHGAGNIIPGLERALAGKAAGDKVQGTVAPEEAYGRRDEQRVRKLPLRKLSDKNPGPRRRYRAQLD